MILSYTVEQRTSYTPVAKELHDMLIVIQKDWGYKVIDVIETTIYPFPNGSNQAFIILYDDGKTNKGESE